LKRIRREINRGRKYGNDTTYEYFTWLTRGILFFLVAHNGQMRRMTALLLLEVTFAFETSSAVLGCYHEDIISLLRRALSSEISSRAAAKIHANCV
jgi:hypothetical protein